ncbi:hypothetical protein GCM10027051_25590 [Niabella terrae]
MFFSAAKAQNAIGRGAKIEKDFRISYGFINTRVLAANIPAEYDNARSFAEDLAAVSENGSWGYISRDNEVVIPFKFDYAGDFKRNRAIVKLGKWYGVVDRQGRLVIPTRYYDLIPYELDDMLYFISRDSSFFAGMIDANGNEILPHQYTHLIRLDGFLILGSPQLYKNIPFYTTYREIDSTQGSFYQQFTADASRFSPEKGRQDIYDGQFNIVGSKYASSFQDAFNSNELDTIDHWLESHQDAPLKTKKRIIQQILDSAMEQPVVSGSELRSDNLIRSEAKLNQFLTKRGYEKIQGQDGKLGVKKGDKIILEPQFDILRWFGAAIDGPPEGMPSYLKENFAAVYKDESRSVFLFFGIMAGNEQSGVLYTMKGEKFIDLTRKWPEKVVRSGLVFRTIHQDTVLDRTWYKYGFDNWQGKEILPPLYQTIRVGDNDNIITKRENGNNKKTAIYFGLYDFSGAPIIPEGLFVDIKALENSPNLYLAEYYDLPPDKEDFENKRAENREFVLIKVEAKAYSVIHKFTASKVYHRYFNPQTGMLMFRKNVIE